MLLMLWSAPRSRSTAFFRMMAERGDFTVVHEPLSYLAEFGYAEVGGVRVTSAPDLFAALRSLARTTPVFVKETTGRRYPEVLAEPAFLATDAVHTFLIRHPRETIASYHAMSPDAPLHKIGFESQYEIFAAVRRLTGREPVVVDSGDLVRRSTATVAAYCAMIGIDFRPDALHWRPADRPEWELSKRWHADVAASTGLGDVEVDGIDGVDGGAARDRGIDVEGHPRLAGYLRHHLPYYEMLRAHRLTVLACRDDGDAPSKILTFRRDRAASVWNYGAVAWELRIELFVADLDVFADFYIRVLGFTITGDHRHDEPPYLAVRRDQVRIGAAHPWEPVDRSARTLPTGVEVVFEADDITAERDRVVAQGWPLEADLQTRPWGLTDFRLFDPDGYYLRITSRGAQPRD